MCNSQHCWSPHELQWLFYLEVTGFSVYGYYIAESVLTVANTTDSTNVLSHHFEIRNKNRKNRMNSIFTPLDIAVGDMIGEKTLANTKNDNYEGLMKVVEGRDTTKWLPSGNKFGPVARMSNKQRRVSLGDLTFRSLMAWWL